MSKLIDMWGHNTNPDGRPGARFHILDRVKDDQYLVQFYNPRDGSELFCQVESADFFTQPGTYLYPTGQALTAALDLASNGGRPQMPALLLENEALRYRLIEYYNQCAGRYGDPTSDILVALYNVCLAGYSSGGGSSEVDYYHLETLAHEAYGEVYFLAYFNGQIWIATKEHGAQTVGRDDVKRPGEVQRPNNVIWLFGDHHTTQ